MVGRKRQGVTVLYVLVPFFLLVAMGLTGIGLSDGGTSISIDNWSYQDSGDQVAYCQADYPWDNNRFAFTIYNGYPGYECRITLTISNTGEKRVEVKSIEIGTDNGITPGHISIGIHSPCYITHPEPFYSSHMLDPGETLDVVFKVYVHNRAGQNTQYAIHGSILAKTVVEDSLP